MNWKTTILSLVACSLLGVSASVKARDLDLEKQPAEPTITPLAVFRHQPLDFDKNPAVNLFRRQACGVGRKQCGIACIPESNTCCYNTVECYTTEYCTLQDGQGGCCDKGKTCGNGIVSETVNEPSATGAGTQDVPSDSVPPPSITSDDSLPVTSAAGDSSPVTTTAGDDSSPVTSIATSTENAVGSSSATSFTASGNINRVDFLKMIFFLGLQTFAVLLF